MTTGPEVWGGVECTVNRVGDRWFDQLERTGHAARLEDLELIAGLGIRVMRYPVLWERLVTSVGAPIDWRWADERLNRLRELGIEPIVGFVHHGSGPPNTSLIDDHFAPALGAYAAEFARRFPWVKRYTPINEPLTTARFSGLYGHWYPHGRDDRTFARALLNQCEAIALAMAAIRRVNPEAELVQTDDLGTTYSTPHMRYQADFDNERRWLSWDLLGGKVDHSHPLRAFLRDSGIAQSELDRRVDCPCPPEVIGINHYVTSDRYLDEDLAPYPSTARGSNGREAYADVDAVRVIRGAYRGWGVLSEAWERYRLPLAVTEVHIGCTWEEQVRWFSDAWIATLDARAQGCDIRAVTAWALFGSYDWDSLLTEERGHYERGAFDARAPTPRPTALAGFLQALISGREPELLQLGRGWWQRPEKLHYERPVERARVVSARWKRYSEVEQ